jgi:hypothetical protein
VPPEYFEGSFYPDFFLGGTLKKVGYHTYTSEKNQVSSLENIWVDATLKKSQVAPYILQGTLQITSQGAD